RTVVLVVGTGGAVDDPANPSPENDVAEGRAGRAGVIEVGGLLVALLHAHDPDVMLCFLDQRAARRVLHGRDAKPLTIEPTVRATRMGFHGDLLPSASNDGRARAQQDARHNGGNRSHFSPPSFRLGPRRA